MKPIDEEIQELTAAIEKAAKMRRRLLDLKARVHQLEFQVNSPKETLIRLEHVDLGLDPSSATYRGELRAYEVEAPSALVSPIRFRETAKYSIHAFDLSMMPPSRRDYITNAAARLGEQMFSRFFERTK